MGHYLNNLKAVVEPFVLLMFKLFLTVIKNTTEKVVPLQLYSNKESYVSAGPQRGHNFLFYLKRLEIFNSAYMLLETEESLGMNRN